MSTNQLEKVAENPTREVEKEKDSQIQESEATKKTSRKAHKKKLKEEKRKNKRPRRRVFPIWLRIIMVIILAAMALVAGLMIGYGVVGDGNPIDILKEETWQHIINIVTKVE
ncbi:DNA-directed RNA polymerase subunit beta [Oceanobacillus senegalensis]|uniref:DNA-directed RNA polymerase subunit beta n=1 Tax=Oceanobacillus senegalensis TaxID=1936063 RepID=UPI000A3122AD|nr:DNA-directed RNA polymerase subunit beta [Oceanobacillus senegalensis]